MEVLYPYGINLYALPLTRHCSSLRVVLSHILRVSRLFPRFNDGNYLYRHDPLCYRKGSLSSTSICYHIDQTIFSSSSHAGTNDVAASWEDYSLSSDRVTSWSLHVTVILLTAFHSDCPRILGCSRFLPRF